MSKVDINFLLNKKNLVYFFIVYQILVFSISSILDLSLNKLALFMFMPLFAGFVFVFPRESFLCIFLFVPLFPLNVKLKSFVFINFYTALLPFLFFIGLFNKHINDVKVRKSDFGLLNILLIIVFLIGVLTANVKTASLYWIFYISYGYIFYFFLKNINIDKSLLIKVFYFLNIIFFMVLIKMIKEIIFSQDLERISVGISNPNVFAAYSSLVIIFNLVFYRNVKNYFYKLFIFLIVILAVAGLFYSYSRGGQLSFLISFVFYIFINNYKKKKYMLLVLMFFLFCLFVLLKLNLSFLERYSLLSVKNIDGSSLDRLGMWYAAVKLFLTKPIFGIGINNYYYQYIPYHIFFEFTSKNQLWVAHNLYLNTLAENGLFGFSVLIYMHVKVGKYLFKLFKSDKISKLGKDITKGLMTYFVYFIVHNMIDCVWTAQNHFNVLVLLTFLIYLMNNVERIFCKE